MKITIKHGFIQEEPAEAVVVNLFEGVTEPGGATGALDKALGGAIRDLIAAGDFKGKLNETAVLYPRGAIPAQRVLIVGLGKEEKFDLDKVRQAAGTAARRLRDLGVKSFATIVHGAGAGEISVEAAAQAVVEGSVLALYQFREHKHLEPEEEAKAVEEVTLLEADEARVAQVEEGARVGQIVAEAACLVRDLGNQPGNVATPTMLAQTAQRIAQQHGLRCQVLDRVQIEELGMGAFMSVARGSQEPPKFIILEHNADHEDLQTLVLVGKGITFDSGGISIKPGEKMEMMKFDMCGGAAVLGALQAVAQLDLPLHVVGLVPATENLPSGTATKPGDIVRALSGKTIEVINTDAEGRMILSDALAYAQRYQPAAVIDLATLTGACVVALGHHAIGLMGSNPELIARLKEAGQASGERVWELPLWEKYHEQLKSEVADMKNVGGRPAGAITAAALLSKFAEGYPWAHLDIAGTAWAEEEKSYIPKGGTGVGVRLLVELLRNWAPLE
jgi:leucyl aminopeptidase